MNETQGGCRSTALVTYGDSRCARGTEVLLSSFRSAHRDFAGDLLVIDGGLPEIDRRAWAEALGCRFLPVSSRLRHLERQFGTGKPARGREAEGPWVFEMFRCEGYRRLVFISGDALVARDLAALFARDDDLAAAPAAASRGPAESMLDHPGPFDAPVLSVNGALAGKATFEALLGEAERVATRGAIDAAAETLSTVFGQQIFRLGPEFHFNIWDEDQIAAASGLSFFDARIIRFAGRLKPWLPLRLRPLADGAPGALKFFELWEAERARLMSRLRPANDESDRIVKRHVAWWKGFRRKPPLHPSHLKGDWRFAAGDGRPESPDPRGTLP